MAQPQAPGPEAQPTPVLSGPKVTASARQTLVKRDFQGRVIRPESTPERAAIDLLTLDPITFQSVQTIFAVRGKLVDDFVADNLDLITKLGTATELGNTADTVGLALDGASKLMPLWAKGSLRREVAAALPRDVRAEFDRLLREYWDAIEGEYQELAAKKKVSNAGEKVPTSRLEIVLKERGEGFGREIQRSVARIQSSGELLYRYLTDGVDLRPEQRTKIRELCADFVERNGDAPPERENQKLFFAIAAELDVDQQVAVVAKLKGLEKPKPSKKPASKSKPEPMPRSKPEPKPGSTDQSKNK